MMVTIHGVDIDDPMYLLTDLRKGVPYVDIMTIMEQVGGAFLFPLTAGSYGLQDYDIRKKTWVVIPLLGLVMFKLKYGDRIHATFTLSAFTVGKACIDRSAGRRDPETLLTRLALTDPDVRTWDKITGHWDKVDRDNLRGIKKMLARRGRNRGG